MKIFDKILDKTTIKSDFKRFWWVSALFMAMMALFILPNCIYSYDDVSYFFNSDEGIFAFITAFMLAGLLYSYLHRGSSVSCLHGMPVTRKQQFFSHYFSGMVLLLIPVIISCGVMTIEIFYHKALGHSIRLLSVAQYFYTCIIYILLIFSVTTLAAMISGNTIAALVFSAGFMLIPYLFIMATGYIFAGNLYGYYDDFYSYVNYLYLLGIENVCSKKSLLYIAASIIFIALSYLLYKKRQLENYDEVVAFPRLRPVFMYLTAICFGLLGYGILDSEFSTGLLGMIPLGYIALTAAFMLNRKSFSPKGLAKPLAVFALGVIALLVCFKFDITGFESRIPAVDTVESVEFDNGAYYFNVDMRKANSTEIDYTKDYFKLTPTISTNTEDIERLAALHRVIIDQYKDTDKNEEELFHNSIIIKYNLKNGRTLRRAYSVDLYSLVQNCTEAAEFVESDMYRYKVFSFADSKPKTMKSVRLSLFTPAGEVFLAKTDLKQLEKALKEDVKSFDKNDILSSSGNFDLTNGYALNLQYNEDLEVEGEKYVAEIEYSLNLNNSYKNTMKLLHEELEKYKGYILSTDHIYNVGMYIRPASYVNLFADNTEYNSDYIAVTDKKEISQLYNQLLFGNNYGNDVDFDNLYSISLSFNVDNEAQEAYNTDAEYAETVNDGSMDILLPYNQLPPTLRKYINN